MKRLLFTALAVGTMATAMSLAAFSKPFHEKYGIKDGSELDKAACGVCHMKVKGGKLNPYGKDLSDAMKADGAKKLTAAQLSKVENKDSDGDGKKNIDEIRADSNPGVK